MIVVFVLAVTGIPHRGVGQSSELLVKKGTQDLIPAGQFDAVDVNAKATSVVTATVAVVFAVEVYSLNYSEFTHLEFHSNISSYEWTSGLLQNTTDYALDVSVPAGISYLVFSNPFPVEALLAYGTNLTLQPS
jgi:hypothetical protein